jgi:hypothetical protein
VHVTVARSCLIVYSWGGGGYTGTDLRGQLSRFHFKEETRGGGVGDKQNPAAASGLSSRALSAASVRFAAGKRTRQVKARVVAAAPARAARFPCQTATRALSVSVSTAAHRCHRLRVHGSRLQGGVSRAFGHTQTSPAVEEESLVQATCGGLSRRGD